MAIKTTKGGNRVQFDPSFNRFTLLGQEIVSDFIDLFFEHADPTATWLVRLEDGRVDFNGQHMYNPNTREHTISLSERNIRRHFDSGRRDFGGNLKFPDIDLRMAAALVLAHEIQHANQSKIHRGNQLFYGYLGGYNARGKPRMKQYKGRACERDAREFVDSHVNEIFAYFDAPPPRRHRVLVADDSDELVEVADLLCECEEVTMDDVRDELRASGILNPKNVQRVLEILRDRKMDSPAKSVVR